MGRAAIRLRSLALCGLVLLSGCQTFSLLSGPGERPERDLPTGMPGKSAFRISQYVFHSDFDLPRNQPLFKELATLREQVYKELQLTPSNNLVQVYLFEDREKYEQYMRSKYPDLPKRRAFFVAQPRRIGGTEDLLVFTYWGDRVQQDLRHELTHALLHSVLKDVPLWLDEGLAEFFEMPASWNGVNYQHLESLRQPGNKMSLERLEKLADVQQMTPAEYRESWAWVHLMLRTTPQARQVLLDYMQELRANPHPAPLRPRLTRAFVSLDEALQRHLADLELGRPRSGATAAR